MKDDLDFPSLMNEMSVIQLRAFAVNCRLLKEYAEMKAQAKTCLSEGRTNSAEIAEKKAAGAYDGLPVSWQQGARQLCPLNRMGKKD